MYKSILIPTDGSELAGKAVQYGIALAKEIGAKITVLAVTVPFHVFTLDRRLSKTTPTNIKSVFRCALPNYSALSLRR